MKSSHPAHKVVFFTLFLDLLGFGLIIPIQPFWAQQFGAQPWTVTMLGASYSLMQVIFVPFWGRLSDRYGRRPIMLTSIGISVFAYFIFASADSLAWLFIGRALSGFGNANLATAQAIVSETTSLENRAKGMGMVGAAFGLGFIFGPAIGGALSQLGPRWPAYGASLLAFVNFVWAWKCLPETLVKDKQISSPHKASVWRFFSYVLRAEKKDISLVMNLAVLSMFYTLAFSCMEQVIGLLIEYYYVSPMLFDSDKHLKSSSAYTAVFLLIVGLTLAVVQGVYIGRLVKRFGEARLVQSGLVVVAVSLFLLPLGAYQIPFILFLLIGVLLAFGSALIGPPVSSLISKNSPLDRQAEYLGVNQSASALGRVIGPMMAGALFQIYPAVPFIFACLMMIILWFFLRQVLVGVKV